VATTIDEKKGWYKIGNIPFYGTLVASDDIVFAEYDDEEMLTYRETVQSSGKSIVQVVIMNDSIEINDVRKIFEEMGCPYEKVNDNYFSMEIPANVNYLPIKMRLEKLEQTGTIGYAESCLSENLYID
jgi:hypothetical protein